MKNTFSIFLILFSINALGQTNYNVEEYLNNMLQKEINNGMLNKGAIIEIKGFSIGDTIKLEKIYEVLEIQDFST
jgi:hypothetical protein